jgi:hypothetical protein
MAKIDQGLWVGSPLSSWQGKCGCWCPKPQTPMQLSHSPVSLYMLWSRRTKSPSGSAWQIEQHSSDSNYQRRHHCAQRTDVGMGHLRQRLELGEVQCFRQDADGVLWFKDRLMVLKDFELRRKIMDKTHCSQYYIHPGTNKMYQDLKKNFWWTRIKREIAKYASECDTCRRIKADHLRPTENLEPLSIPEWKWENICMDFIVGLPNT